MLACYTLSMDSTAGGEFATHLEFLAGGGSYTDVVRDCHGDVVARRSIGYTEFGGAVTQDVGPVRARVAAGRTTAPATALLLNGGDNGPDNLTYVAPSISIRSRDVEFGFGYLFAVDAGYTCVRTGEEAPSADVPSDLRHGTPQARLRLGREDRLHLSAQYAWEVPASAGTGAADVGAGFAPGRGPHRLWLGVGLVPDEAVLLGGRADIRLHPSIVLLMRGHVALSGDAGIGGAVGSRISF